MPAKIRKQVYELTPDDFLASPVWEFALDEESEPNQDEATVRSYTFSGALDPSEGMFVIAAHFWLANGKQMRGCLTPPSTGDRSLGTIQPQLFTDGGQVSFWCGRSRPDTVRAYQLLGGDALSVFPIRFESAVPLTGGTVYGTLPGFLCLENDFKTVRTVQ